MDPQYNNRDLSWLGFNARVLAEAADSGLPLETRLKFLSIFSSNLDEFYSVRIPVIMAMEKLVADGTPARVQELVQDQMVRFGAILEKDLIPWMHSRNVHLLYKEPVPSFLRRNITDYFYNRVLAFLQPLFLLGKPGIVVPEHNKLLILADLFDRKGQPTPAILNIPTDFLPRFYFADDLENEERMIVFLDDVIKSNLDILFHGYTVRGAYSFKITRNTELDLEGEYKGGMARKLEKKLKLRAYGPPTRFLHEPGIPEDLLDAVTAKLELSHANRVVGGAYHNLKDLAFIPLPEKPEFRGETWPPKKTRNIAPDLSIFEALQKGDLLIHPPYHSYQPVFRFFNEAASDPAVREICIAIYRVATDSQIMHALISAARNGKKVVVFVELKARFDEANNLNWAKKMKAAGIRIVYSRADLKVHSKIAWVKRKNAGAWSYYCLLATGNFNESTARFYTDHILMTTDAAIAGELETLFRYMAKPERQEKDKIPKFEQLLVSPFNLQERFLALIDGEMQASARGEPASIMIKLNNLEEKVLIRKLYEASQAGVRIQLMIRSICCLVPGLPGLSENISVRRLVDHYLEHGRVFVFHNQGRPVVLAGSADWMIRNIYHRIEVCFPIRDEEMKQEMIRLLHTQWADNVKAVYLDQAMENIPVGGHGDLTPVRSQRVIYESL